jgi:hypothetical protein
MRILLGQRITDVARSPWINWTMSRWRRNMSEKKYIPYVIMSSRPAGKHVIYRDGVQVTLYEALLRLNELEKAEAQAISTLYHPADYDVS